MRLQVSIIKKGVESSIYIKKGIKAPYYKININGDNIQQNRYYQAIYINYIIKLKHYIRKESKK